ncbi:hypothetical protein ARMSODRAFT_979350 [Armillaria solidipes]|uniref:Uncharacterized protein n=1 Tax=Armillaria solidipes TaxID=1076256 RepID=A0A2H3BDW9_9AGAR|nr:hypothetical protein ARMSODRAFT_979350 [Armillaria solidipes]
MTRPPPLFWRSRSNLPLPFVGSRFGLSSNSLAVRGNWEPKCAWPFIMVWLKRDWKDEHSAIHSLVQKSSQVPLFRIVSPERWKTRKSSCQIHAEVAWEEHAGCTGKQNIQLSAPWIPQASSLRREVEDRRKGPLMLGMHIAPRFHHPAFYLLGALSLEMQTYWWAEFAKTMN